MRTISIKLHGFLVIALSICSFNTHAYGDRSTRIVKVPTGIRESLWRQRIPKSNPISTAKVELGRSLFFDKRLSSDGTLSCASCHDPAFAFTDSNVVAVGAEAKRGIRNSPTILNAAFAESLFWDGRARSLEEQVEQPLMSAFEMGMKSEREVVNRISEVPEYRARFRRVFGSEGLNLATVAKAIAAYERTLLSGNSPFDRFITGKATAITPAQLRGWELFKGKAKCIECHAYSLETPFFTDFKFHNTGVGAANRLFEALVKTFTGASREASINKLVHSTEFAELGRFVVTTQNADIGAFKTPTLRDVELTSPYMHDGSLKTLIDVVNFYNQGGHANSNLDHRMKPLQLSDSEVNDVVEFMRSLTSDDVLRQVQTSTPQKRTR